MINRRTLLGAGAAVLAAPAILRAQSVQKLTFHYPVAVGGPTKRGVVALRAARGILTSSAFY